MDSIYLKAPDKQGDIVDLNDLFILCASFVTGRNVRGNEGHILLQIVPLLLD